MKLTAVSFYFLALLAGVSEVNNLRLVRINGEGPPAEICYDYIGPRFERTNG